MSKSQPPIRTTKAPIPASLLDETAAPLVQTYFEIVQLKQYEMARKMQEDDSGKLRQILDSFNWPKAQKEIEKKSVFQWPNREELKNLFKEVYEEEESQRRHDKSSFSSPTKVVRH